MAAPGPQAVPRPRSDTRFRKFRGKALVAGPTEARELSESALFVWQCMDGCRTVAELGERLAAEYGIDVAMATGDVAELIGELVDAGILELADG